MDELISTIDKITIYGLNPNLVHENKELLLEKNLVKIYSLYFIIEYEVDNTDYPEFDKVNYFDIRKNVDCNFKRIGHYKAFIDILDYAEFKDIVIGDAIDDLTDIILDLLEIKWRIENNSLANGLWFFELIFKTHTQQHIVNLLNYLKQMDN